MAIHKEIKLYNNENSLLSLNVTPNSMFVTIASGKDVVTIIIQSSDDMRRLARFILDEVKEEEK